MNIPDILRLCYRKALDSPDPSTQNGAVLCAGDPQGELHPYMTTLACNGLTRGASNVAQRWERPEKYAWVEHAERNSIYNAARHGRGTIGLTMVCPWAACADCARAIVQTGIGHLVTHKQAHDRSPGRWHDSIGVAFTILAEAGVTVEFYDGPVSAQPVLHSGQRWTP